MLSVSSVCETGKFVVFGPAPKFESYVLDDPNAYMVSNGKKTYIDLINGTYSMECSELKSKPRGVKFNMGSKVCGKECNLFMRVFCIY